jgi:hypothetical protein
MKILKYLYIFNGCVVFCIIALVSLFLKAISGNARTIDVALEINDAANVATGGKRGEKVSSRAWRNRNESRFWGLMVQVINLLFWDKTHCLTSYKNDFARGVYVSVSV